MRAHALSVLCAAEEAGIRHVDVARSYGRAEEFLATWLASDARHPRSMSVSSKWGYRYTADWRADAMVHELKDHSLGHLDLQYAETRALLGNHLDLYQVHSATRESGVLDDHAVLRRLAELGETGLQIGLTTTGPAQEETIRRALDVTVGGRGVFTAVQSTWNPLEPSAGVALAEAKAAGWTVLVKEAVANGRLAPGESDASRRAVEFADRLGVPLDQLAIAAALAQPWTWSVLSGGVDAAQVASNAAATAVQVPPDVLAELTELAEEPAAYWSARAARAWS
jgi:aryl-alcohol dehydrogenase-like predicted oxidoreductase